MNDSNFFKATIKDKKVFYSLMLVVPFALMFSACGGGSSNEEATSETTENVTTQPAENATAEQPEQAEPETDLGIGPVTGKVELGPIDAQLAEKGHQIFEANCTSCHKLDKRYVGPALIGVTKRARPEWIMNMILNPSEMTQKDPIAKDLLATYMAQMANQNLTEDQARAVLEYFRQNDVNYVDKDTAQNQ